MIRRLPVYLLIDCSESMVGGPIVAVEQGLAALVAELKTDPQALETVWLSVIGFSGIAKPLRPLTDILEFQLPQLSIGPGTGLGAALACLCEQMDKEVRTSTPDQKGDWKPLVFLLTDGQPTDAWKRQAQRLSHRSANVIAVGCGLDADTTVLRQITPNVLRAEEVTGEELLRFFQWVSASVTTTSIQIGQGTGPVGLPPLPADALEYVADDEPLPTGPVSNVVLAGRCRSTRAPFLTKYRWDADQGIYYAEGAYAVNEDYFIESRGGERGGSIDSVLLQGSAACPSCDTPGWGKCSCGGILCCPEAGGLLKCPHCNKTDLYVPMNFDVKRTAG